MGVSPTTLVLSIWFFWTDGVQGYSLASSSSGHWVRDHAPDGKQEDAQPYNEQPRTDPDELAKHYGASREINEAKYPFIAACHHRIKSVIGKNTEEWYTDWKLWIGVTLWFTIWVRWLKHGYDEIFYQRALFAMGINIMILHYLQYAWTIKWGMLGVCTFLMMQSLFQTGVWFRSEIAALESNKHRELVCLTMYLDVSLPLEQICCAFFSQIAVFWFFMTSILGNFDFDKINYAFWFIAFTAMQMTMIFNRGEDSFLGCPFPLHDVHRLWVACENGVLKMKLKDEESDGEPLTISKTNIAVRGILGFFCNAILREIMAYTIPLMLMSFHEPMDFVVYCVGVNFICTVDDMGKKKFVFHREGDVESARTKDSARTSDAA